MADGQATINKWQRKIDKAEDADKKARDNMKKALSGAMKDPTTHRNLANELLRARQGGNAPLKQRESFGDDGEIFTGFYEDRPWDRD